MLGNRLPKNLSISSLSQMKGSKECFGLKNMQWQGLEKGDRLIKCRFQDRTLYRYEAVRANFVWGEKWFLFGDEFGWIWTGFKPEASQGGDKGHILPSHSDSTPLSLLQRITHFILIRCNHTTGTSRQKIEQKFWDLVLKLLSWKFRHHLVIMSTWSVSNGYTRALQFPPTQPVLQGAETVLTFFWLPVKTLSGCM